MAETEYTEERHLSENQAEMFRIQQEIGKNKARAEVYGKHVAKSIDGRSQVIKWILFQDVNPVTQQQKQCIAKGR